MVFIDLPFDADRYVPPADDGFPVTPGTAQRNERSGEVVFVPPQNVTEIIAQMTALQRFVNDDEVSELDPLIKRALIHTSSKASIPSRMQPAGSVAS